MRLKLYRTYWNNPFRALNICGSAASFHWIVSPGESNFVTITEQAFSTYTKFLFRKLVGKLVCPAERWPEIVNGRPGNFENWLRCTWVSGSLPCGTIACTGSFSNQEAQFMRKTVLPQWCGKSRETLPVPQLACYVNFNFWVIWLTFEFFVLPCGVFSTCTKLLSIFLSQVGFAELKKTADNRANIGGTIIGAPIVGQ